MWLLPSPPLPSTVQELFDGSYEGQSPHYARNMINQKITFPRDDNFSDDELAFLPYFVYFHTLKVKQDCDVCASGLY